MDTVGIRELKAHLSWHLKRVRSGAGWWWPTVDVLSPPSVRSRHQPTSAGPTGSLRKGGPARRKAPRGSPRVSCTRCLH